MQGKKRRKLSPAAIIVFSFIGVILLGTVLLLLPFSTTGDNLSFIDALFVSSSTVTVTGLMPVSNVGMTFSVFGKIVLASLIQIGGLGWVTLYAFILTTLGVRIGINDRIVIKKALNLDSASGLLNVVKRIVIITFSVQAFGFILNLITFWGDFPFWKMIGISAFHAISSFNNCGLDILGVSNNLVNYSGNILLNFNTTLLVFLGGLGTIVIYDILKKRSYKKLTIHSKIVLKVSLLLVILGTLMLKVSERDNITWLQAYFTSISVRTAGFATVNYATFKNASLIIMMMLTFIGASPVSTGGGIKTTTFYTIVRSITSASQGKKTLTHNRKISEEDKLRAFTLFFISIAVIISGAIFLLLIEEGREIYNGLNDAFLFKRILFEATSAFGTSGITLGLTPSLHWGSKVILMLMMLFGRIGPITIFSLWNKNWNRPGKSGVEYIEEKIIIG